MSKVKHNMGAVEVSNPMRPATWDTYVWQAISRCTNCNEILVAEYQLPSRILFFIPSDRRDEAMRIMADFVQRHFSCMLLDQNGICRGSRKKAVHGVK